MTSMPPHMRALPDHASTTPASPDGAPAILRFRERVRARIGAAELLALCVGGERFAFDVRALDEAIDRPAIDRIPWNRVSSDPTGMGSENWSAGPEDGAVPDATTRGAATAGRVILRGLMRAAGRSIPVFDTGPLLGVPDAGSRDQVLIMRSGTRRIGLLADDVDDVILVDLGTIQPPPVDVGDDLLLGVTWDGVELTGILDARALIQTCQHRVTGMSA